MYLKDKSMILSVRVDKSIMDWLENESKSLNVKVSDLIRMILNSYCRGARHENVKRD